jgi:type I restriction enzyme S subunit
MEEWKEYKLGELSKDKGCYGIAASAVPYSPYLHTYLRITDINDDGTLNKTGLMSVSEDNVEKYILKRNDIVFARTGNSTGRTYFYDGNDGELVYAGFLIKFSLDASKVNPRILKYYTHSKLYYDWVNSFDTGGTRGNINAKTYSEMPIILPPRAIQDQIVSILKSLDDKIEVNKQINDNFYYQKFLEIVMIWMITSIINDNLEQQAQALFKSWFVDFEPFKDGEFVDSELGRIPKGWKVDDIYAYIDVVYGAPYKSSLFNEDKKGLPLIRIRDLKTNSPQIYTPEILPTTEYVDAGDIIAGMDAEFIPYMWLGNKGVLNQRCCKFKGKDHRISNFYILNLVKPKLEFVQSYKTGTTVSHLGKADIDRFHFVTPPLEVILSFSKMIDSMKNEVVTRAQESRRLAGLRDTLLPKLMSGELQINK